MFESAQSARGLAKSQQQLDSLEKAQKIVKDKTEVEDAVGEARAAIAAAPGDLKAMADDWLSWAKDNGHDW